MSGLVIFFGPPENRSDDDEAVSSFIKEDGGKIILGGTTSLIFERRLKDKTRIDLKTSGCGMHPYGFLGNIIVAEGTLTIKKLNEIFFSEYTANDAVKLLKNEIMRHDRIKIYHGRAFNPVNGIDKNTVFTEFVKCLRESGKSPEIVNF
ncbi:MAG: hypothetical protein JEZ04_01615 [Spirochaetales bacterium]|nr:hypothetical protein [Spirochaetales bacterium]